MEKEEIISGSENSWDTDFETDKLEKVFNMFKEQAKVDDVL